jgi:predicted glycogen debranching enzyme
MRFGPNIVSIWERAYAREWLLANGRGGYAGGTVSGANTRRYHGLLIDSPPEGGERRLFVSKLHEELTLGRHTYYLASGELADGQRQGGHIHLIEFVLDPIPTFVYRVEDVYLIKELFMVRGEATTIVRYTLESSRLCKLRIYPLVNNRSHHDLSNAPQWPYEKKAGPAGIDVIPQGGQAITLDCSVGRFNELCTWYYNMAYPREKERGEPYVEHHFIPGFWEMEMPAGGEFAVSLSLHGSRLSDHKALYLAEKERQRESALRVRSNKPHCRELARAGDIFIIERNGEAGLIAGYPWFEEWGRDAMISLPGLLLIPGRFAEARQLLARYGRYEQRGLLPNFIPDRGEPHYNSVDASLWYFQAVKSYLDYTGDLEFVGDEIYRVLKNIIHNYRLGTDYGIVMDADGLVTAVAKGVQLTWMDAKIGDWVVTPRYGKTVEVNALWYNALYFMTLLAGALGDSEGRKLYGELALRVHEKFATTFWCMRHDYLADLVYRSERDERLRPNQILALSLPYRLLQPRQEQLVLSAVGRYLYTPFGLRTLAPYETDYHPLYEGDRLSRDGAYHQGTAWGWLVGPYITAIRRTSNYSAPSRRQAARILAPFFHHLYDFGLVSIAEIFDAEHPHTPRGCPFQAWSVAELLRAYVEDVLEKRPAAKWLASSDRTD